MINVLTIKAGTRLLLSAGIVAEVIENMEDGMWLQVRYLAVPRTPAEVGTIELCHAQDIIEILREPSDADGV
jgi:hypothetical protein